MSIQDLYWTIGLPPACVQDFIALWPSLGQNEEMNHSHYLLRLELGLQASKL